MARTTEESLKDSRQKRQELHNTLSQTRNWGKSTGATGKRNTGRKIKSGYGTSLKYSGES